MKDMLKDKSFMALIGLFGLMIIITMFVCAYSIYKNNKNKESLSVMESASAVYELKAKNLYKLMISLEYSENQLGSTLKSLTSGPLGSRYNLTFTIPENLKNNKDVMGYFTETRENVLNSLKKDEITKSDLKMLYQYQKDFDKKVKKINGENIVITSVVYPNYEDYGEFKFTVKKE